MRRQQRKRAPYFHRTKKNAAMRAAKRRRKGKHGAWLSKMPSENTSKGCNNCGRAPRYLDWPAGKRL